MRSSRSTQTCQRGAFSFAERRAVGIILSTADQVIAPVARYGSSREFPGRVHVMWDDSHRNNGGVMSVKVRVRSFTLHFLRFENFPKNGNLSVFVGPSCASFSWENSARSPKLLASVIVTALLFFRNFVSYTIIHAF